MCAVTRNRDFFLTLAESSGRKVSTAKSRARLTRRPGSMTPPRRPGCALRSAAGRALGRRASIRGVVYLLAADGRRRVRRFEFLVVAKADRRPEAIESPAGILKMPSWSKP